MDNSTKIAYILAGIVALALAVYSWKNIYKPVSESPAAGEKAEASISVQKISPQPKADDPQAPVNQTGSSVGLKSYSDNAGKFSFKCPEDWEFTSNKDYGKSADFFECAKMFFGPGGFEDGVAVNFGFVPKEVYETYEVEGKKESDSKIGAVKNQENAQVYANNLFNGWISMKNGQHTFSLVAFREAEGGYYEVRAEAAGSFRTDSYFKNLADSMIGSFEENSNNQ